MKPLHQLYPNSTEAARDTTGEVDIIAVHGPGPRRKDVRNHAWDTWCQPPGPSGRLWLRDELPRQLPGARIFIYEYETSVVYGGDLDTFINEARDFLEALIEQRQNMETRSILFLGHGSGVLLMRQTLVVAYNDVKYTQIEVSTIGMVFFTTPDDMTSDLFTAMGYRSGDDVYETLMTGNIFSEVAKKESQLSLLQYDVLLFLGNLDHISSPQDIPHASPSQRVKIIKLGADYDRICKFGTSADDQDHLKLVVSNIKELYEKSLKVPEPRTRDRFMLQVSIRAASTQLALYKASTKFFDWMLWVVFLYIFTFSVASETSKYWKMCVVFALVWSTLQQTDGRIRLRRPFLSILDRGVPLTILFILNYLTYRYDTFLHQYRIFKWLSYLASSTMACLASFVISSLISASKLLQSFTTYWWFKTIATLRFFKSLIVLFAYEMFIDHGQFMWGITLECIKGLGKYLGIHFLLIGYFKMFWGYNDGPWFYGNYFFWQACWFMGKHGIKIWEKQQREDRSRTKFYRSEEKFHLWSHHPYRYKPIPSTRHIRLLLIHARHPLGPIECSLVPVPIDDAPMFEAISYTWGNPSKDFDVFVDGAKVRVTRNAFNVIKDISSCAFPRLIWIDSICINQSSVQDKTDQVRMMREIYSRASRVTIWLRPSSTDQYDLARFASKIGTITAAFHLEHLRALSLSHLSMEFQYQAMGGHRFQHMWQATVQLLDQPYFERSWIIQEVVLSTSARVMCHGITTTWENFAGGLMHTAQGGMMIGLLTRTSNVAIRSHQITSRLASLIQIHEMRVARLKGAKSQFATIAHSIRNFQATIPGDKVFAIQGLCEPAEKDWTDTDYSKSLHLIYLDSARRIIHENGIIGHLEAGVFGVDSKVTANLEQLPSWAPDWSRETTTSNLCNRGAKLDYKAGGLGHGVGHQLQEFSLILSAHILDKVNVVGDIFASTRAGQPQYRVDEYMHRSLASFSQVRQMIDASEVVRLRYSLETDEQCTALLWRLLIGDCSETSRPAPDGVADLFNAWRGSYAQFSNVMELSEEQHNRPATPEEMARNNLASKYLALMTAACLGRRACCTSSGHVGLLPAMTERYDIIAIVLGAQTPFVLRPVGRNMFKLVGQCYVHGIMNGEALGFDLPLEKLELV